MGSDAADNDAADNDAADNDAADNDAAGNDDSPHRAISCVSDATARCCLHSDERVLTLR